MKYFNYTIALFLLFGYTLESQEVDFKEWSKEDELVWEDFRKIDGNDDANETMFGAVTVVKFDYVFLKNGSLSPPVVLFDKLQSYARVSDSLLLKHEQIHFDIHEINARKIRKEFIELYGKKEYAKKKYTDILERYLKESEKINREFDRVSYRYSPPRNKNIEWILKDEFCEVLRRWRTKVDAELSELEEYSLD